MIEVTYKESPAVRGVTLQVRGHSGRSQIGSDIVCSAVSILTYTVASIFKAMSDDFNEPPLIRLERGDAEISAVCKDEDSYGEALRVLLFAKTGYRLLQASYPENVRLVEADEALE